MQPDSDESVALASAQLDAIARAWETDRVTQAKASERRAWRLACAGCAAGLVGVVASASVVWWVRSRPVPPPIVHLHTDTGHTEVIRPVERGPLPLEQANIEAAIKRFVRCNEEYTRWTIAKQYDDCQLLTDPDARERLGARFITNNPTGLYALYRDTGSASITFKSVTHVGLGSSEPKAMVRFAKTAQRPGDKEPVTREWFAEVSYKLSDLPAGEYAREINPFGFLAVDYRSHIEDERE